MLMGFQEMCTYWVDGSSLHCAGSITSYLKRIVKTKNGSSKIDTGNMKYIS